LKLLIDRFTIFFTSPSTFFYLYGDVTFTSEGLQFSALKPFKQGGIFIEPQLLWHAGPRFSGLIRRTAPFSSRLRHKGMCMIYSNPDSHGSKRIRRISLITKASHYKWRNMYFIRFTLLVWSDGNKDSMSKWWQDLNLLPSKGVLSLTSGVCIPSVMCFIGLYSACMVFPITYNMTLTYDLEKQQAPFFFIVMKCIRSWSLWFFGLYLALRFLYQVMLQSGLLISHLPLIRVIKGAAKFKVLCVPDRQMDDTIVCLLIAAWAVFRLSGGCHLYW
jgi:hypothetical protein